MKTKKTLKAAPIVLLEEVAPILLVEDKHSIANQQSTTTAIQRKLQYVYDEFRVLDTGLEFPLTLLNKAGQNYSIKSIVQEMMVPSMKNVVVEGARLSPRKFIDLIDIDFGGISSAWESLNEEVKRAQLMAQSGNLKISVSAAFYTITADLIQVNEKALEKWIDDTCRIYTQNDKQVENYQILDEICTCFNKLRQVNKIDQPSVTLNALRDNPTSFLGSNNYLRNLVEFDEYTGLFVVKGSAIQHIRASV